MSIEIIKTVLFLLQLCLGLWQFMKLTPAGALIQGGVGWLLRFLRLSPTYSLLKHCRGKVFKRANCFVLQADIPSERRGIVRDEINLITLKYLGSPLILERRGDMLFIDNKMCYYITRTIWAELQTLLDVIDHGPVDPSVRAAARAEAEHRAAAEAVERARAERNETQVRAAEAADRLATARESNVPSFTARAAAARRAVDDSEANFSAAVARKATARQAADRAQAAAVDTVLPTLFVKGKREFWEEMITGGVMSLKEVLESIILYNQHVSTSLNNDWLLPVNLSVSEEKLVKFLNLVALSLQINYFHVQWLIPTGLSIISAFMEFSTRVRVWFYTQCNVLFCYIMHSICDTLPRSWRRQVYSLGNWVENLKPCNDIQLKVVKGTISAIITEGAKVDREGAIRVPWLNVFNEEHTMGFGFIEMKFRCNLTNPIDINCMYVIEDHICTITAPGISLFDVNCRNMDNFNHIITLVSRIAESLCGSLISYGPSNKFVSWIAESLCGSLISYSLSNKVRVRGFKESVTSYVNSEFPSIYKLELENVVVA